MQHSRTNAWECRNGRGSLRAQSVWNIPVRHNQGSMLGSPPHNPHQQKRSFHQRRQDSSGWQLLPSEQRSSCAGLHELLITFILAGQKGPAIATAVGCSLRCADFSMPLLTCRPVPMSSLSCARPLAGPLAVKPACSARRVAVTQVRGCFLMRTLMSQDLLNILKVFPRTGST